MTVLTTELHTGAVQSFATGLLVLVLTLLGACAGDEQPPPEQTVLEYAITVQHEANQGPDDLVLPFSVWLYELNARGEFQGADFYGLHDDAQQALGDTLIASERVLVTPGSTARERRTVDPEVRFVGVLAGYRDISRVVWRDAMPVEANTTNNIVIDVGPDAVVVYKGQ